MGTTDSPTPADDLAELRAYAEKGPAVSRATCARLADRLEAAGPDLRTAAQALLDRIADHDANLPPRRHVGDWPTVEALRAALARGLVPSTNLVQLAEDMATDIEAHDERGVWCSHETAAAIRAALAAEATEPPPDSSDEMLAHLIDEWGLLGVVSAALDHAEGKAIDVLNAAAHSLSEAGAEDSLPCDPGSTPNPQGADEPCGRCEGRCVIDVLATSEMSAEALDSGALIEGTRCPDCNGTGVASVGASDEPTDDDLTVLWEQETKPSDGDPTKSYIAPPLLDCPPGTSVAVVQTSPRVPPPEVPAFDPDAFDADALVVILGLADLDPLVGHDGAPPARCALCGAEAPGGAQTLAPSQHLGGCLWVSARELAEVVRGGPETP